MSSGKVKCTCGWSWNKSDSSKKDMYICHECGRDNSNNMKNGGWLDSYANGGTMQEHQENYNDSEVSLPEGFVGMGYNTKGRNYSPAWGGSFQGGGSVYPVNYVPEAQGGMSIPGAVGFSYARVGAPSKGPRRNQTDVTDASAQNGKEMKYYQEGLDFKPKSISKNGGWLDSYDVAQDGKKVEYGTPEYREAYNKGEVVTDEGGRSPILLDEVIVNKKSPAPGFWKQSRDRYLEEHQDDGILGAIGSVATYPLGVAQQAMMYGLTGKVQTPTEGMGIRKGMEGLPGTILNTVVDPVNLIGAGILTKENALAKLETSIAPELRQGLQTNGFLDMFKSKPKFNSEINWGKWNKEIPNNPQLMNEYNTIEQTTKANGSWMKNPDGSAFKGTPEQFVQQNSQNFKKAFGNSKLVNPDGSPTIQYHGSAKNFDTFDESKFQLGDAGYSGKGIYTTPDKGKASSYALSSKSIHKGDYDPTVYELYGQGNNPISAEDLIKQNKDYDLFNFHREKNWQGDVPLEQQMLDYDVAIRNQTRGIERVSPWNQATELVFPTNKQLKSAVGNNGMFDMTNPNIYKAVVPGAIGLGALGSMEKQKDGGVIKDDMGYWNPDNWDSPVEIGSNEITMKHVPFDVLGISDEGDIKHMKPGKNYKFKGKKVTEYPMAKNGLRQEQKGLVNLDQLTNFTNYNTKQPGGWLDNL